MPLLNEQKCKSHFSDKITKIRKRADVEVKTWKSEVLPHLKLGKQKQF
jgi:hypothetical protein